MRINDYGLCGYLRILIDKYNLRVMSIDDYGLYGSFLNV